MKKKQKQGQKQKPHIGWREWISLPKLGVDQIKAKIDTGALTSALHATDVHVYRRHGDEFARFTVYPNQRTSRGQFETHARVVDERTVKSSTGHVTIRPVIQTSIQLAHHQFEIELTLIDRDVMGFRMLLGRRALRGFLIDPARSFLQKHL